MLKYLLFSIWTIWWIWGISQNFSHYSFLDWIIVLLTLGFPFIIYFLFFKKRTPYPPQSNHQDTISSVSESFVPHGTDEYLDEVLPNGKTIREIQYENFIESISKQESQHTDDEEDAIRQFNETFEQTISLAEEKLYTLANSIYSSDSLDTQILKTKSVISHYEHFKDFCYSKGIGGTLYFQDMWEHCHNSSNPDFDYIDRFKEKLEKLEYKKYSLDETAEIKAKLKQVIQSNPGILQKDIYESFSPDRKPIIRSVLLELDNQKVIRRTKKGNTYELFLN